MANNNYPQITSVTSESLQAQIRNLLPSQEGFGTDLMAQNVIVPVIDLTSAAEGSTVPENLQTAIAFGSQTAFSINDGSSVIANTTGFYRIFGCCSQLCRDNASVEAEFNMSDGLSTKTIWQSKFPQNINAALTQSFDFIVFLASGESLSGNCNTNDSFLVGSSRQIADVNGTLVNPSGFNPQ